MHKRFGVKNAVVLPLLFWWGAMFCVTTTPSDSVPQIAVFAFDKLIHGFMYFGLTLLLFRFLYLVKNKSLRFSAVVTSIVVLLYGVFDEWHQQFIGREASVNDYVADTLGVVLALLLLVVYKFIRTTRSSIG